MYFFTVHVEPVCRYAIFAVVRLCVQYVKVCGCVHDIHSCESESVGQKVFTECANMSVYMQILHL